jgi:hypothetical protein
MRFVVECAFVPACMFACVRGVRRSGGSRMEDTVHVGNESEDEGESESDNGWKGGIVSVRSDAVVRR